MAIFGRADENLPYLTRFYQVEMPDHDGLDTADLMESELWEFLRRDWERTITPANEKDAEFVCGPKDLWDFFDLHYLLCPLMDAWANGEPVPAHTLHKLADLLNQPREIQNEMRIPGQEDHKDDPFLWVPVSDLDPEDGVFPGDARLFPVKRTFPHAWEPLLREVSQLFTSGGTVRRCVECSSPFPLFGRRDQVFCSHRCADRTAARRRRAERNAAKGKGNRIGLSKIDAPATL